MTDASLTGGWKRSFKPADSVDRDQLISKYARDDTIEEEVKESRQGSRAESR